MARYNRFKGKVITVSAVALTTFFLQSHQVLAQEQANETATVSSAEVVNALTTESENTHDTEFTTEGNSGQSKAINESDSEKVNTETNTVLTEQLINEETNTVEEKVVDENTVKENEVKGTTQSQQLPSNENEVVKEKTESVSNTTGEASNEQAISTTDTIQPAANEATPQTDESNAIVNVQPLWDSNFKGQGTVIAVIDSGFDVEHDVLHITDISTAKYKSEAEIEEAKKAAGITYGKWYNEKVVFGYNYVDVNTELKESDPNSHGAHVSGIAAGNPTKPIENGDYIRGVAPEAQLMFMRVFSDTSGGTSPFLYVKAIDDAVKLGADSINLSLGAPNGTLNDIERTIDAAVARARKAGVTVVIAAGNDTVFGEGHADPDADKPDYGVVATPSVAKESVSVASYNNTHIITEVITVEGMENNATFNNGKIVFSKPADGKAEFSSETAYEYEYVGLGQVSDFEGKDLTGKVALIQRGGITFTEKIKNAKAKNAVGAIIFNNAPGDPSVFRMQLGDQEAANVPALFISQEVGKELADKSGTGKYKIVAKPSVDSLPNPQANKMSNFSSWGLSSDGELKPDVSAPGGSIYSSVNDQKYGNQSGTSMASPHVAGVVALMKQSLAQRFPQLSGEELQILIKNLLMSTANPHYNEETKAYTSPRQQGAGIVDTAKAVHSDFYVTGDNQYGSISLGNVGDTFDFNVTVHNLSNKERALTYITHLATDTVENGKITLKPRELSQGIGNTIFVPANGKVVVPITVDATKFTAELDRLMKNGYYLEGFVRFLDTVDDAEVVSIPFVGFKGEFENLAVLEKPIYEFEKGENPFYYQIGEDGSLPQIDASDYTALIGAETEWDHIAGDYSTDFTPITMGTFENADGKFVIQRDKDGKPFLAISPNGDGNRDALGLRAVFLRNFEDLQVSVYGVEDTEFKTPIWQSQTIALGHKNYYSGQERNPKSVIVPISEWDGKDSTGKVVKDGEYVYVISYKPVVPGAAEQKTTFTVKVDTVKPAITTGVLHFDKHYFAPRTSIESQTGIYRERLYYVLAPKTDANGNPVDDSAYEKQLSPTKRVYITRNADGSFTLPETDLRGDKLNVSHFWYSVEDRAGNSLTANLSEFQAVGNENAIVNVRLVDAETGEDKSDIGYRYFLWDQNGKDVNNSTQFGLGVHKLPFGTYTAELLLYDEDYAKIVGPSKIEFTVNENNSLFAVDFKVKSIDYSEFRLEFDGPLPVGSKVFAVDQNGNREEIPRTKYVKNTYEKRLVIDPYTIVIELPRAYQASENNFSYTVVKGKNIKRLSVYAKGDLTKDGDSLTQPALPELDLTADNDQDGFTNEEELVANTNPLDPISIPLVQRVGQGILLDPLPVFDLTKDDDQDDFTNEVELTHGTNPYDRLSVPQVRTNGDSLLLTELPTFNLKADDDKDGYSNGEELVANTRYNDAASVPKRNINRQFRNLLQRSTQSLLELLLQFLRKLFLGN